MPRTGPVTKDTSTVALGLAQIRVGNAATNIATITAALNASDSIGALANTKFTGNVDYWRLESGFPMLEDLVVPIRETAMLECAFKELTSYNLALARGIDPGQGAAANATATLNNTNSAGDGAISAVTVGATDAGVVDDQFTVVFSDATTFDVYGDDSGDVGSGTTAGDFAPDNGGTPYFTIPTANFSGTWAAGDSFVFTTTAYVASGGSYSDAHGGEIGLGALSAPAYVRMEAVYTYPNQTNHMYVIFPRANVTTSTEIDLQSEDNANVPITFEAKRADSEVSGGNAAWDAMPLGRIYFD